MTLCREIGTYLAAVSFRIRRRTLAVSGISLIQVSTGSSVFNRNTVALTVDMDIWKTNGRI